TSAARRSRVMSSGWARCNHRNTGPSLWRWRCSHRPEPRFPGGPAPPAEMRRLIALLAASALIFAAPAVAQRYSGPDGRVRVALAQQPFSPTGTSVGPQTMANGGIQDQLTGLGALVRLSEAALTPEETTEYGAWKRLGMALGHFADQVAANEREG